jgi:putative restriction endonuclease
MGQDPDAADNQSLREARNAGATRERARTALRPARGQATTATGVVPRGLITAYNGRCALSGLPEPLLLDAHIVADKDERFVQPVVPNRISLSKIQHAAL